MSEYVPDEWQDIVDRLAQLTAQQNLSQRAVESCAVCFERNDNTLEYKLADIRMEHSTTALYFSDIHYQVPFPYVDTTLRLYVGTRAVGYYRRITLLNGSVHDDWLVFR